MSRQFSPVRFKPLLSERFEIIVDARDNTYRIHDRLTGFVGLSYHCPVIYDALSTAREENAECFDLLCEKEVDMQREIQHDGYVDKLPEDWGQ